MKTHDKTPSAGKLELANICPASHAFPHIGTVSDAAELGGAKHKFLERVVLAGGDQDGVVDSMSDGAGIKEWAERITVKFLIDRILQTDWEWSELLTEQRFLMDWRTGHTRFVPSFKDRTDDDIAGIIDLMHMEDHDGDCTAADYKTGRQQPFYLSGPEENLQVRCYGSAVTSAYGTDHIRVVIAHIDEEGTTRTWPARMLAMELDAFAAQMAGIMGRVFAARQKLTDGELPKLTVGDHCAFCPALVSCPANAATATALVAQDAEKEPVLMRLLAGEKISGVEMVKAHRALKAADKLIDQSKKALARLLEKSGPIAAGDGKELYIQERKNPRIDPEIFLEAVDNFGRDRDAALKLLTISKTKINATYDADDQRRIYGYLKANNGMKFGWPSRYPAERKERKTEDFAMLDKKGATDE